MSDTEELLERAAGLNTPGMFPARNLFDADGGFDEDVGMSFSLPALQVGREVTLVRRVDELCLGLIGGTKVCLGDCGCSIGSHKTSKFDPAFGGPFLLISGPVQKRNNAPTGFCAPCLSTKNLEPSLIEHLLTLESGDSDLSGVFGLIDGSEITTLDSFNRRNDPSKTVRKKNREESSPKKVSERTVLKDALRNLGVLHGKLKDYWGKEKAEANIDNLENAEDVKDIKKIIISLFQCHYEELQDLREAIIVSLKTIHLHSSIRSDEIASLHELCKGLEDMISKIIGSIGKKAAVDRSGLSDPSLWGQAAHSRSRLDTVEKTLSRIINHLQSLISQVNKAGAKIDALSLSSGSLQGKSISFGSEGSHDVDEDEDSIMRDIGGNKPTRDPRVRKGWPSGGGYGGRGTDGFSNRGHGGHDTRGVCDRDCNCGGCGMTAEESKRFKAMEEKLRSIDDGNKGDTGVKFGGKVFRNHHDVGAFFDEQFGEGADVKFSCFANPYAMMNAVFRRLHGDEVVPKDLGDILKLGLRSQEVYDYLSIHKTVVLPKLYTSDSRLRTHTYTSKSSAHSDARFKAIPSAIDFGHLRDEGGLYQAIMREIRNEAKERRADINLNCVSADARILAYQTVTESTIFCEENMTFLQQTYVSLMDTFDKEEEAWDCVCKSVEDLWRSNFLPAKSDMASADLSNARQLAELSVWTSLRLCSVATTLTDGNLSTHPDVSNSYIRFLLKHVGAKQSSHLQTALSQVSSLRKELQDSKKEVSTLQGQIKSIESRVDKLVSAGKKK